MQNNTIGDAPISEKDARMLSPLKLAYLGDAVLDLFVREHMVKHDMGKAGKLHKKAVSIVNATAQARFALMIETSLTETESDIFRRGRNAKSGMVPKNSPVADYRIATGFETLLGYWYASGQYDRLKDILDRLKSEYF